ncbi:Haloacid dehalogenase-like hydrolase domain-containing protein [Hibiscus syriacus]|uniref:Haloacid dehalogenase-like hydrolase domain-containing protein n=1 Tax=Hibiscus syriacus TaxID=106335 RepID=A0A6A2YB27_HIBSY|nr:Haloacid dehalogenase-like hydrolase domain-containing protein [Hibiscus syriacus]
MASTAISLSLPTIPSSSSSSSSSTVKPKAPAFVHRRLFIAKNSPSRSLSTFSATKQISTTFRIKCSSASSSSFSSTFPSEMALLLILRRMATRDFFLLCELQKELGVTWDVELYGELLKIGSVVSCLLGTERAEKIQIFSGDVVPRKKPDPAIYTLAANTLGVEPSSCENTTPGCVRPVSNTKDSAIGLAAAAKAAGMTCNSDKERICMIGCIRPPFLNSRAPPFSFSIYTADEDFLNVDAVFDCIGDPPEERFDLAFCASLLDKQ